MKRTTPQLLFICIAQAMTAWLFYRSRAVAHLAWADSDFLVFVLPLVLGFAFSALILWRSAPSKRGAAIFVLAAICALISSFVGTAIGFNLYGT